MHPLEQYAQNHSSPVQMALARHEAASDAYAQDWAFVRASRTKAQLVALLAQLTNPEVIVEVGTFTGYTTLALSLACPAALIQTFDSSPTFVHFARKQWDEAYAANIRTYIGDAKELLHDFAPTHVDFAFIDANKEDYLTYYEILVPKMHEGGLIVLDDTLWFGDVLLHKSLTTYGEDFKRLNKRIAEDERVEALVLPFFENGFTICRKRGEEYV